MDRGRHIALLGTFEGADAAVEVGDALGDHIGQILLVEVVGGVDGLVVDAHHFGRDADGGAVGGQVLEHHAARADAGVVADIHRTQHLGASADKDIVAQGGVAYKYINFSWKATKKFCTRIRSWQISPVLGTIDHNYQAELKKANHRLIFAIICVSLLVIALALLTFYVNKQKSYLSNARNELKKTNTQLEELNNKLSSTNGMLKTSNDKLNESNGVKEEYIGQFLGACSHYIDKLDKMRLNVNKRSRAKS